MRWLVKILCRLLRRQGGTTTVEYAVMLALIISAAVASVEVLGCRADLTFRRVANSIPDSGP